MGNVLAVVEQRDGKLRGAAGEVVSAAATLAVSLGSESHALLLGGAAIRSEVGALGEFGASLVKVLGNDLLTSYHPDGYSRALEELVREGDYQAVLLSASEQGKDLAPRVAARLDVPLAQDVTSISADDGQVRLVRPVYAGKALARIRVEASPVVATLRPNAFPVRTGGGAAAIEELSIALDPSGWLPYEVLAFESAQGDAPDLSEATVVVSGGRGMRDPEHWGILEELRKALGSEAGLGASRAVVDAGWRPHAEQVGQTGRTVSPKLYFAIGISGAIQHLAGMRTAGTIVAVNRDPDAPIFRVADYGIVGDAFEVVPRLSQEIRALRGR